MKNSVFKTNISISLFEFVLIIVLLLNAFELFKLVTHTDSQEQKKFRILKDINTLKESINELEDYTEAYIIKQDENYKKNYLITLKSYVDKQRRVKNRDIFYSASEKKLFDEYKIYASKQIQVYNNVFDIFKSSSKDSAKRANQFLHKNSDKIKTVELINIFSKQLSLRMGLNIEDKKEEIEQLIITLLIFTVIFIIGNIIIFFILLKENRLKVLTHILLNNETQEKELYKTIFTKSKDGILIIENGIFIECNDSATDILGYKSKFEILDKTVFAITPEYQPDGKITIEKVQSSVNNVIDNGYENFELVHKMADGTLTWIDVVLTDISTTDKNRFLVVWRQLDSKKRLEKNLVELRDKAVSANIAKSQFLANMSHEIRTPLNAIMGFIELLKEDEKDKQKQKYLSVIDSSSKTLIEIINDILDFSKIESGNLEIEHLDFNPAKEFSIPKKLFKAKFQEKNIRFFASHFEMPDSLNGDVLRIKQVINNLLSNAIKFTPKQRSVYLDIDYKDSRLYVQVKDEGIGISKQYQQKIFEAFTQEDGSTTRKYGGTGLGLAISNKLINAMGGELRVKSKIGYGSKFYFDIPLSIGGKIEKPSQMSSNTSFKGYHTLLVEDNKANQMFMKIVLKKLEMSFDIANDGVEAVDAFKSKKYDFILMDENMPNLNGIEATKQILEIEENEKLKHTPIVALTANALKGDREKFLNAGMDEYLSKPLNRKKLEEVLLKLT